MKILTVPFSAGGWGPGCEKGPDAILAEMKNLFLNEFGSDGVIEIVNVPVNSSNLEETSLNIEKAISVVKEKCIILGGDHSITYGAFKGFLKNNHDAGLVVFDAHPDLMSGTDVVTHEDFFRTLIENKYLDPSKLIIIGVRNWHKQEYDYIKEKGIQCIQMKDLFRNEQHVCDGLMQTIRSWSSCYLSIDIDVIDPAFAPGTGYCEPGGMSSRELIYFIHRLRLLNNIKMIDIVEINPDLDVNGRTAKLGAKILKELL